MPLRVTITGHEQINALKALADPETYRKAIRAGLKYGGDSGKVAAAKEIGARYNLKAAEIKADIAGPYINVADATVEYRFSRKPRTLKAYSFKVGSFGATGSLQRGIRLVYPRAFEHKGLIFQRVGGPRLPIDVPHGPSVGSIALGKGDHSDAIQDATIKRVQEQWLTGVERALSAAARRR